MMKRQRVDNYTGPKTSGFDVSKWQGDIEWSRIDDDFEFVFVRTGDGRTHDSKFDRNWRGAKEQGIRRGAYHYFRADRDGFTQAHTVISMMEAAGGFRPGVDLPPVVDLEGGARKNLPGGVFVEKDPELPIELVVEELLEFLQTLEDHLGVVPIIYKGQAFHWWLSQSRPQLAAQFDRYPLWIASYSRGPGPRMPVNTAGDGFPWSEWTIWQHTGKGESDGIEGNLDENYFRGDEAALDQFIRDSVVDQEKEEKELCKEEMVCLDDLGDWTEKIDDLVKIASKLVIAQKAVLEVTETLLERLKAV